MQFRRVLVRRMAKHACVKVSSCWKAAFLSNIDDTTNHLTEFSVCLEKLESLVGLGIPPHDVWKYLSPRRQGKPTARAEADPSSVPLTKRRNRKEDYSVNRAVVEQVRSGVSQGGRTSQCIEGALLKIAASHKGKFNRPQKRKAELLKLWHDLSVCWAVAEDYGLPLSSVLVVFHEHAEDCIRREYRRMTSLAGPVMSTKIMLGLPFAALIMTHCAGMGTIDFLLCAPLGWLCLLCAGASLYAARRWVSSMVSKILEPSFFDGEVNGLGRCSRPNRRGERPENVHSRYAGGRHTLGDIALVIDLVGGLLECGMSLDRALEVLTPYVRPEIMFNLRSGGTREERDGQGSGQPGLETTASVLELSRSVGVPSRRMLASHAKWLRRRRKYDAERKIEALGVKIVLPLGVCVLPAFFCLAIFPVVAVVASGIF